MVRAVRLVVGLVGFVVAVMVSMAVGATVVAAQAGGSISGLVTDGDEPVSGVEVDLFEADADGNRIDWLTKVTTDGDGYRFDVTPGCYSVTVIAPPGRLFTNGRAWSDTSVCVAAGEDLVGVDAQLVPVPSAGLSGTATLSGSPYFGALVNLYLADGDGGRGQWLGGQMTSGEGRPVGTFQFDVQPGCYVLTYSVEDVFIFAESDSRWLNREVCVEAGQQLGGLDATVVLLGPNTVWFETVVVKDGLPVDDVVIDIFEADGDGGRGRYLKSEATFAGTALIETVPGCYVATLIAPTDLVWEQTGTTWFNIAYCLERQQSYSTGELVLLAP